MITNFYPNFLLAGFRGRIFWHWIFIER